MQFIDIHGHYAWDVDDGIPSKEDAIKALEIAKENNITTIAVSYTHLDVYKRQYNS